jgi:hypothetical protein
VLLDEQDPLVRGDAAPARVDGADADEAHAGNALRTRTKETPGGAGGSRKK